MANTHNYDHYALSIETVDDSIIACSYPKDIFLALPFLRAGRIWITAKLGYLAANAALECTVEGFKLAQCRNRKFDSIAHKAPVYSPNCFLIFAQGMVGSFRRLRASSRSMRSSMRSSNSRSSSGTTAATGFLRRCTMTRSLAYAARFTMSENV